MEKIPSLCRATGHTWVATTADNFYRCSVYGCPAVRRRSYGQWIEEVPGVRARKVSHTPQCELFGREG
jgi:hypothetical protein